VPLPFSSVGFSLRQRNATARFAMLATQSHIVLFAVAVSSVGAQHAVPERATRAPEPATHCALWSRESRSPPSESKPANTNIGSIGATNTLGDKTMHLSASPRWIGCLQFSRAALVAAVLFSSFQSQSQAREKTNEKILKEHSMDYSTAFRTVKVDDLSIFYREAGPKDAPTLLLLHGLPSSSRMFEPLFARLSDRYHMIAPDYPGFGHSDWPDPKKFAYTFDHIADVMNHFTEALGLSHYSLYMQDYGGPVGFRMILAHPDRVETLIVQDAVAHNEGLGENWKTRRAFWDDRAAYESALRTNLLSLATTRSRHVGDDPNVERHDPDLWTDEFYFLNQPGQGEIQVDLFYDYRTNVENYPKWQAWLREKQPRLLVIWGKYESSFDPSEPESYRRDVPKAEIHIVDGGHFAIDTAADQIAMLIRDFMK
jgi:pimeloyl-ACP methyl ester carboxylesterase